MDENLLNKNKNINRGYRSLDVWKESVELYSIVKNKIDKLKSISFKVKAQIEDSAFSVSSNIAFKPLENFSRFGAASKGLKMSFLGVKLRRNLYNFLLKQDFSLRSK